MPSRTRCIFISGQPGCGKTYLLRKAQEKLAKRGLRCSGFLTEEVLKRGIGRVGFDIVTIPGGIRQPFARKRPHKNWKYRTGEYVVNVDALDKVGVPTLRTLKPVKCDVFVIDEIGRMELHSSTFKQTIEDLLASGQFVLASVAAPRYGHKVAFAEAIKKRRGVINLHLKASTRESVALELDKALDESLQSHKLKPISKNLASAHIQRGRRK